MSVAFCCCSLFNISFLPDARPNLKIQSIGILATCFGFCISLQLNFWAIVTFSFWLFHTKKKHTHTLHSEQINRRKKFVQKKYVTTFLTYMFWSAVCVCVFVFFVLFSVPLFSVCFFSVLFLFLFLFSLLHFLVRCTFCTF